MPTTFIEKLKSWLVPDDAAHHFPEAAHTRHWAKLGLGFVVIAFGAILLWGFLAPLHGAVVGKGQVKVESSRQVVQHQEGGIVKAILVKNGSIVHKGDPLVVLEDLRVDANYDITIRQYLSELAKNARLLAESDFASSPNFPAELLEKEKTSAEAAEILTKERSLFNQRRRAVSVQVDLLGQQIRETESELVATTAQVTAEKAARKSMLEEVEANKALVDKGFISNARYLALYRNLNDYDSRIGEHGADIARARQKQIDLKIRSENVRNEYRKAAAGELKDSTDRLNEAIQRVRPLLDMTQRQQVLAPVDGSVVDLRIHTVGAAVGPRDPLMDIVPLDQKMVIEAKLPPDSISELRLGMRAEVRLTSFKQRVTPMVEGELTYISADSLSDKEVPGQSYYLCQIVLSPESLQNAGITSLVPGMPADVFIRSQERTAIQYLLDPVLDSLNRSFREK